MSSKQEKLQRISEAITVTTLPSGVRLVSNTMSIEDIKQIIDECLTEPVRNCDRYTDELDAQLAFLNEVWLISVDRETMLERDKYEKWTDEMRKRYGRWLLAPTEGGER